MYFSPLASFFISEAEGAPSFRVLGERVGLLHCPTGPNRNRQRPWNPTLAQSTRKDGAPESSHRRRNTRSLDFARDDGVLRLLQGVPLQLVRKDDSWAFAVYAPRGRARLNFTSWLILTMSTANVERVAPAMGPGKTLGTSSFAGRNGILCRYFYFAMSLLFAAIVFTGFKRTVNENLFHPAVPRPFILWIHASAFTAWVIFFICQSALVRVQSQLASLHRMVWRRARRGDGPAGRCYRHRHGPL
jgi:hypothetical protein